MFEVEGSQPRIAQTRESISPPPQLQQQHYCERATLQRQEEDLYAQAARDAASGKDGLCQSGVITTAVAAVLEGILGHLSAGAKGADAKGVAEDMTELDLEPAASPECSAAVEPSFVALAPPTVSSAAGETERDGGSPTEAVATAFDSAAGEDATASGAPASAPALAPPAALSGKAETGKAETETEGRAEKRARPPRGKRLRNELMDSSGFAVQWRQICRDSSDGPAGSAARALGLSMLAQSSVRGVTRRASQRAGEACVVAELQANPGAASLVSANRNAIERPHAAEHSVLDLGGEGGLRTERWLTGLGGVAGAKGTAALPASLLDGPSASGDVVGALASGILARIHFDQHERKEVPIGVQHQIDPPDYLGPYTRELWPGAQAKAETAEEASLTGATAGGATAGGATAGGAMAVTDRSAVEGSVLSMRAVEEEAARSTAARLTAAAYGSEAELTDTLGWIPQAADAYSPPSIVSTAQPTGRQTVSSRPGSSMDGESGADGGSSPEVADACDEVHACDYCGKVLSKAGALTMHTRFCQARLSGAPRRPRQGAAADGDGSHAARGGHSGGHAASEGKAPAPERVTGKSVTAAATRTARGTRHKAGEEGGEEEAAAGDGKRHRSIKKGEGEHACPACGRRYASIASVNRHLKLSCETDPSSTSSGGREGGVAGLAPSDGSEGGRRGGAKRKHSKPEAGKAQPAKKAKSAEEEALLAEPDVFVVEKLLGERYYGTGAKRRKQYLVRWEGYSDSENTWEDVDYILDDDLIDEYRREKRAKAPALTGRSGGSGGFISGGYIHE